MTDITIYKLLMNSADGELHGDHITLQDTQKEIINQLGNYEFRITNLIKIKKIRNAQPALGMPGSAIK